MTSPIFNNGKKPDADQLAIIISRAIESEIAAKLGSMSNPVLKKAMEEALRDEVYKNLQKGLAGQIKDLVGSSLDDITSSLVKGKGKLKSSFRPAVNDDSGSKGSGSKGSSIRSTPKYYPSSGSKGGGFGGK